MKRVIASLVVYLLLVACSSTPVEEAKAPYLDYPPELSMVHSLVLQKKTADAHLQIEDYLNRAENLYWYGHAWFLKGFVYEIEENYPKAIKYYKSSLEHGAKLDSKVAAKSLYNLSFIYEKLDKKKEMVSTLVDLMKRRKFFDPLTGRVEIPARLAGAYAALGKMKEARIFHREAARSLKKLVRGEQATGNPAELSKSMYYLGLATFPPARETYSQLLQKIKIGQAYFLSATETADSQWAERSKDRLQVLYEKAWDSVLGYQVKGYKHDPMAKKKQEQMRQLVMASELYDLVHQLRAEEFPQRKVNRRAKMVMDRATAWVSRIEDFALKLDLGPQMVRNKRVRNKRLARYVEQSQPKVKINKELTKKKKKKQKLPTKSLPAKEESLPPPSDIGKDPNL